MHQTFCISPIVSELGNTPLTWLCYTVMRSVFCLISHWLTMPFVTVCIVIFQWGMNASAWVKELGCGEQGGKEERRNSKMKRLMSIWEPVWIYERKKGEKKIKAGKICNLETTDALRAICLHWGKVTWGKDCDLRIQTLCADIFFSYVWYCIYIIQ